MSNNEPPYRGALIRMLRLRKEERDRRFHDTSIRRCCELDSLERYARGQDRKNSYIFMLTFGFFLLESQFQLFMSSSKRTNFLIKRNEESRQLALCTNCNLFVLYENMDEHTSVCVGPHQLPITQLNQISQQLCQIQELCIMQMADVSPLLIKYKQLRRLCEICSLINQLDILNITSMKLFQNIDAELNILRRLSEQSASVNIFINRIVLLMDEKIALLEQKYASSSQSFHQTQGLQAARHSFSVYKANTQSTDQDQSRLLSNRKYDMEQEKKFRAKYMEKRMQLGIESPANKLSSDELYRQALSKNVSPREWSNFIVMNFAAAERASKKS